MNTNIINSKTVLFLGAGASAYLEKPLMVEFVNELLNDPSINLNEKNIIETITSLRGNDLEEILKEINEICGRGYFKGATPRNYFKDFFDQNPKNILGRSLLGFSALPEPPLPDKSNFGMRYSEICDKCSDLRWKIYEKIFEVYYNVDGLKVKDLYSPLFNFIQEKMTGKRNIVPVFTTNYDKAIETLSIADEGIELIDGFIHIAKKKIDKWSHKSFNDFKPKKNKLNLCLFKLHGSIFWYRVEGEIIYSHVVTSFPTDRKTETVILFPDDTKEILADPYITSYSYLQKCFDKAEFIIFVGYSFRDYITITFLKSALRFNEKLKVIIIDPNSAKIYKRYFDYYKKRFLCVDAKFTNEVECYTKPILAFLEEKGVISDASRLSQK